MTQKQELIAQALARPDVKTQAMAAQVVGVNRCTVAAAQRNPAVIQRVQRYQNRQADKARRTAQKALSQLETAIDNCDAEDPETQARVAGTVIVAAAKHVEAFGEDSSASIDEAVIRESKAYLRRRMLVAARMGARYGERAVEFFRGK